MARAAGGHRPRGGASAAEGGDRRGESAWRQANAVEDALRPAAMARDGAHGAKREPRRIALRMAAGVTASGMVAVTGAIVLYRRELQRERLARPPMLRGEPLPGVAAYLRPTIALAAWRDAGVALGVAGVLWLAVFALPRTRRWALRWGIVPALLGASAWLGARWFLT